MIFQVTGTGPFPVDMLRYDRVSPASECDSAQITKSFRPERPRPQRHINLFRSNDYGDSLTEARWQSFGWTVVAEGQEASFSC